MIVFKDKMKRNEKAVAQRHKMAAVAKNQARRLYLSKFSILYRLTFLRQ